jgi:recombination protein RecT
MSTKTETNNNGQAVTTLEEKPIVAQVASQIMSYLSKGTLHLPADYSVDNALKSAWLYLLEAVDKDKKPLLQACTRSSIVNALLDYAIQGLNTAKKQAYFIAYGGKCVMQRSYFGDQAIALRVQPGITFYYQLIRRGDEVRTSIIAGRRIVIKHESDFAHENAEIIGAYAGVLSATGEDLGAEVMTIEDIKRSWSMSKTYNPQNGNGTHVKFEGDMALRTVIRKRCKPIFNVSNDHELLAALVRSDVEVTSAEMDEEVTAFANAEVIDMPELPEPEHPIQIPAKEATTTDQEPGY